MNRKAWQNIKSILAVPNPLTIWYAITIRKRFGKLHAKVVATITSSQSIAEKEAKIVIPLRTLTNDVKCNLPQLFRLINKYRMEATNLYPVKGEEDRHKNIIAELSRVWEKADERLAKLSQFKIFGIIIPIPIVIAVVGVIGGSKIVSLIKIFFVGS